MATREGLDPVRTWTGRRQEGQRGVDQLDLGLDDLGLDRQPRIWITLARDWTGPGLDRLDWGLPTHVDHRKSPLLDGDGMMTATDGHPTGPDGLDWTGLDRLSSDESAKKTFQTFEAVPADC